MKLTYLGHACFLVESGGYRLVLDPYDPQIDGYAPLQVEAHGVLCSHSHHDHCYTAGVRLLPWEGECPIRVETVSSFHDDRGGALRGPNRMHVLSAEGLRLAHLGDLGHTLTAEQLRALGTPDVVLIPVGGTYTLDGAQAARVVSQLGAAAVIPMHYRCGALGFPVLQTVDPFLKHCSGYAVQPLPGNSWQVQKLPEPTILLPVY